MKNILLALLLLGASLSARAVTPYVGPSIPDRDGTTIWNIFSDSQTLTLQPLVGSSTNTGTMIVGTGLPNTLTLQNLTASTQSSILFDTDGSDWSLGVGGSTNAFVPEDFYILKNGGAIAFTIAHASAIVSTPAGINIGNGTTITKVLSTTATIDFPSTAAGGVALQTVTLTGVQPGDQILVSPSAWFGPIGVFYSSANTVTVEYDNSRSSTQDPTSRSFTITALHF